MTLRLAWHNDGWNGRICRRPERNTHCVGCSSYPGELIREKRDLAWEKSQAGKPIADLENTPPCMYSVNAFGDSPIDVFSEPPEFFRDDTETRHWELPENSACIWPYEAMYNMPGVRKGSRYDYDARLKHAEEYFESFSEDQSLIFYYANYSNPVSSDERPVYLIVGVARLKKIHPTLFYENCSEETLEKYKGYVWQRGVTSHYPEQGMRVPYHRYLDDPDTLQKFAVIPENPRLCKYATRHVSDDEALGLLEQLLEAARIIREDIQDESENWDQRIEWLEGLVAELWQSRGAFPGMPAVLEILGLSEAISGHRQKVEAGEEIEAVREIRQFVAGKSDDLLDFYPQNLTAVRRRIKLQIEGEEEFWLDIISRLALNQDQVRQITGEERESVGIAASRQEIQDNPYLLAEQYVGIDQDDRIRWSVVDRGILPSPELSARPLFEKDAPERLRALLLETLRSNSQQTFLRADELLSQVNSRVKAHPEWKQNLLTEKYLDVDRDMYEGSLHFREIEGTLYVYDREVWSDERLVQKVIDNRLTAPDIQLNRAVGESFWKKLLYNESGKLARSATDEYQEAVQHQVEACAGLMDKRVAAITGGAGTGKTTVIAAFISGVRKVHGEGAGVAVLAPTGKATDRLRVGFAHVKLQSVHTVTIHSILARHGWLNSNMTFKHAGGQPIQDYDTIIIDECSMLDLTLMAALFRAIDWNSVRQLILVGDAAQLPPIGIGKVYAEIISYFRLEYADHLVELTENLRQMENRVSGRGNGILRLANNFINSAVRGEGDESPDEAIEREELIASLNEGDAIDQDLEIVYWEDPEDLPDLVIGTITGDFRKLGIEEDVDSKVWQEALKGDINSFQILSPVRGELYGTETINQAAQDLKSSGWMTKNGAVDGLTLFDKVIQVVNRPKSRPLKAFNFESREVEEAEVFNGEIGTVVPSGSWTKVMRSRRKIREFSVQFAGKNHLSVNYGVGKDRPEGNLELAYALSVHKAQGSEFGRIYLIVPEGRVSDQAMELIYTAITRASEHCTIFVQNRVETLLNAMRPEQSALKAINSSLFEFNPVATEIRQRGDWYEAGRIHKALTGDMVRSKSEVIIANMLHERGVSFWYEKPLRAPDGTLYLPDFTILHQGEEYYWEHLGKMAESAYRAHWEKKESWYEKHFPGRLVTTKEDSDLSDRASDLIESILG